MSRRTVSAIVAMALSACDGSSASKGDETWADRSEASSLDEVPEEDYSSEIDVDSVYAYELGTTGGYDDDYGCGDSECAADDGDICHDGVCDVPPVPHKNFTGNAAKVEKQIIKEQLQKDVAHVEAMLKDLDSELASR